MLFVKKLSEEEKLTLEEMFKNHPRHTTRTRAHSILLSHQGIKLKAISEVFNVCRQTSASWLHAWENFGICGLMDDYRSGRPRKIPVEKEEKVLELVNNSPRKLHSVLHQLSEKFGIEASLATLKRVCKRLGLCWKRVRKSLKSKQDPELFAKSKQQLAELIEKAEHELIDLYYVDQSGFSLEPCVPYAWQPIGETIKVPCSKSKRLNVMGFMSRKCEFQSWVFEGSITSASVVACINQFALSIKRETVLIVDNAPIHTSAEFVENIAGWKEKGLIIVPIASYSPELNLIEILWRKIKYEWLPFSAYESFQTLKNSLFDILANIGKSYTINFA